MLHILLPLFALFAQAAPPAGKQGPGGGLMDFLPIIVIMVVLYYLMLHRPQKREQSRRLSMLAALKKNDRVLTTSGIYGVVTNVHREADEVSIKVDETSNTKLRMTLGSIAQVLGEASDAAESK
jgi:preprotein translocase subunit YajC